MRSPGQEKTSQTQTHYAEVIHVGIECQRADLRSREVARNGSFCAPVTPFGKLCVFSSKSPESLNHMEPRVSWPTTVPPSGSKIKAKRSVFSSAVVPGTKYEVRCTLSHPDVIMLRHAVELSDGL
jgi:hypothetical protein